MSNNSNMIPNYSNRISYNSNMIKNNSDKRYRITAKKDEKLNLEMLSISIISISEKLIMPFFIVSWVLTSVKFIPTSGMYL